MPGWETFALLALLVWGLWGFFPKLATPYMSEGSALLYDIVGAVMVGVLVLFLGFRPEIHETGMIFAILTGAAGTLGTLFLFFALKRGGEAMIVVPMTALYPIVTIILARVFLGETIGIKPMIGILLALVAIPLLSSK